MVNTTSSQTEHSSPSSSRSSSSSSRRGAADDDDDKKTTSSSSSSRDDNKSTTAKEIKEDIPTTPEHTFKEIETALNKGNNRKLILDYIIDALGGLQSNSLSDQQKESLKNTVNKNLLNKLD